MATAVENLNKHLQLAVRQLKIVSGTVSEIPDTTFDFERRRRRRRLQALASQGKREITML